MPKTIADFYDNSNPYIPSDDDYLLVYDSVSGMTKSCKKSAILLSGSIVGKDFDSQVLADNPDNFYKFNETSGNILIDYSGNNYDGSYNGGITKGQNSLLGKTADTSCLFDGISGFCLVTNRFNMKTIITSEIVLKTTSTLQGAFGIFAIGGTGDNTTGGIGLLLNNNSLLAVAEGVAFLDCGYSMSPNTTYHIVFGYDNSLNEWQIFVNGKRVAKFIQSRKNINSNIFIGKQINTDRYFKGLIGRVAFYDYQLSQGRIFNHFKALYL